MGSRSNEPYTILVVEDSEPIAQLLVDLLEDDPRYRPVTLAHPRPAFSFLGTERPDLLILDLGLPEMNGLECYERARQSPHVQDVPALFISANDAAIQRAHALGLPVLHKPFEVTDLLEHVAQILGAAPEHT